MRCPDWPGVALDVPTYEGVADGAHTLTLQAIDRAGNVGQVNYISSKAGIIGFTKALAREYASRNITVNAIAPGFIETPMTAALNEAARNAMLDQIPLKRAGTDTDVANAVAFLASDEAGYITGQVLNLNGGRYM